MSNNSLTKPVILKGVQISNTIPPNNTRSIKEKHLPPKLSFTNYTIEDGLPLNIVTCSFYDSKGSIGVLLVCYDCWLL